MKKRFGADKALAARRTELTEAPTHVNISVEAFIEKELCKALKLEMVNVPLIVDTESGVNDMLDRDGSRTPIQFHISNDRNLHPVAAQVVQLLPRHPLANDLHRILALNLDFDLHPDERAARLRALTEIWPGDLELEDVKRIVADLEVG